MKTKKIGSIGLVLILLMSVVAAYTLPALANDTVVSIGDIEAPPGGTVTEPIMVTNVTNLGGGTIKVTYDTSIVHVTDVMEGDMTLDSNNTDNSVNPGWTIVSTHKTAGISDDVVFVYLNYTAVDSGMDMSHLNISVISLFDIPGYDDILYTVSNGSFTVSDDEEPSVTDPSANPATILNDNGRPRPPGTNISQLNVTVTDNVAIDSVSIDLSPIGGKATQSMTEGSTLYTVITNATIGVNLTHNLAVNATDTAGYSNTSVSITLTVLRRGDIVRDDKVDMKDMLYIARYTAQLEPEWSNPPSVFVGDVVGSGGDPLGDGVVNMKDALYIARWTVMLEDEP